MRRPTRRKLSLGDMIGMGSGPASPRSSTIEHSDGNSTIIRKLTPWIVLIAVLAFLFDWFLRPTSARNTIYSKPSQMLEMAWKGKVAKKYLNEKNRNNPTVMLMDSLNQPLILDFSREKTGFWDQIEINNVISKPSGSLSVRVKTYVRDTTLVMEFE